MKAVVLHRVVFLEYFSPKQGQDFKLLTAPLYPIVGQVSPPPPGPLSTGVDLILQSPQQERLEKWEGP